MTKAKRSSRAASSTAPAPQSIKIKVGGVAIMVTVVVTPPRRPPPALLPVADSVLAFVAALGEGRTRWPLVPCASLDLHRAYLAWAQENDVPRPMPANTFLARIARIDGWSNRPRHVFFARKRSTMRIVVPAADLLDSAGTARPDGMQLVDWLSDGVRRFAAALRR